MDKYITISIYIVYLIIGAVSIVISLQVSIVMALIVLAIEGVRLIAIYKKVYVAVFLVFIGNMCLVSYNSYKSQTFIEYNNEQIQKQNSYTQKYLKTKDLRANTAEKWKKSIQKLQNISIDWWFLIGAYIFLELTLLLVIKEIRKQDKKQIRKPNAVKKDINNGNTRLKVLQNKKEEEIDKENLIYVGSYAEYSKEKNISRRDAKTKFEEWKSRGKLIKKDGKNYLRS